MLNALLGDRIARIAILIWVTEAAALLVPVLPADWMRTFSTAYLDIPSLIIGLVAILTGLQRITDQSERRFWRLLAITAGAWLLIALRFAWLSPLARWSFGWKVFGDLAYAVGYLGFVLAIEIQPHRVHPGTLGERERQLRTIGTVVLAFFLLAYFVIVPAWFTSPSDETPAPAFSLFLSMDIVIVARLMMSRRDAWSVRWSWVYTWLTAAAAVMLTGDLVELGGHLAGLDLPVATAMDLLWTTPFVLVALAARTRDVELPAEFRVLNEASTPHASLRAGHLLVLGAMTLPVAHLVAQILGAMTPDTHDPREAVAIVSLISLGSLALAAYRVLERDRERILAKELRLVSALGVARKMDAVARLAASVAHDFNNLLHIIQGRTGLIGEHLSTDDPLQEEVREVMSAATRAGDLAGQLMAFGRTQPQTPETVNLHALLGRAEQLAKPLLDERTRLAIRPGATLDVVRLDPLQFERVILNLVTNARDAMPDGGEITIETCNPGFESLGGHPYTDLSMVRVTVSDTGQGMTHETMAHIFEPFYTTKSGRRGAGLGLAITHGLIQQAGGSITVESDVGAGATFTITLPAVRGASPAPVDPYPERHAAPGAVMVVDMDPANRQLLRRLLVDLDRPVLTAATGQEALLLASKYPGPVDVAVIDVTCDGGRTLATDLRETQRTLRTVLLAQDQPVTPTRQDILLREPFELGDVLRSARTLLHGPVGLQ